MLTSLLAAVALQGAHIPQGVKFVGKSQSKLTQSFYDLEDDSLAERYTFDIEQSAKLRPKGYDWQMECTLAAHRLGDLDLDVPKSQKARVLNSAWNEFGMDVLGKPFIEDWTEYRIERLRWFFWPPKVVQLGETWSDEPPIALDHDVPRIRLTFRLEGIDGANARVISAAEELGVNGGLRSSGRILVNIKTGWIERGEWTSPSVPMPGGVQTRYRLVQEVRPIGEVKP